MFWILYRITTKRGIFSCAFLERHIFTVEWWLLEKFISVLGSGIEGLLLLILFGIIFSSDTYSCKCTEVSPFVAVVFYPSFIQIFRCDVMVCFCIQMHLYT